MNKALTTEDVKNAIQRISNLMHNGFRKGFMGNRRTRFLKKYLVQLRRIRVGLVYVQETFFNKLSRKILKWPRDFSISVEHNVPDELLKQIPRKMRSAPEIILKQSQGLSPGQVYVTPCKLGLAEKVVTFYEATEDHKQELNT